MRLFVVSLVVLFVAGFVAGCGGGGGGGETTQSTQKTETTQKTEPTQKTEAVGRSVPKEESGDKALVRVSGTEGVSYSGTYGDRRGSQTVEGVVGADPVDYEVDLQPGFPDTVTANLQKTSAGAGTLRVEIVYNGAVVASDETSEEYGVADANWSNG